MKNGTKSLTLLIMVPELRGVDAFLSIAVHNEMIGNVVFHVPAKVSWDKTSSFTFHLRLIYLGTKVPGKGTLKRKRWICDQYIQENENYEDDMYENKKFEHFQSLLEVLSFTWPFKYIAVSKKVIFLNSRSTSSDYCILFLPICIGWHSNTDYYSSFQLLTLLK